MYRSTKKKILVNIIREIQCQHTVTDLTVFEYDSFGNYKVCYSGSLDDFMIIGKTNNKLKQYRERLLHRHVQQKIVYHKKIFVWLDNAIVADYRDNASRVKIDKIGSLLQEGRYAYLKAEHIKNSIFSLFEKFGISDTDRISISLPNSNNLTEAITQQLTENEDHLETILETVSMIVD